MLGDATAAKPDRAIGARGQIGVVRRDDESEATFLPYLSDEIEEGARGLRIEAAGRLVGEQDPRTVHAICEATLSLCEDTLEYLTRRLIESDPVAAPGICDEPVGGS
jgi:hypothetical protein